MSKHFETAAAEIADTSYSRAVEQVLHMAAADMTPRQAVNSVGLGHWENPTWEDAVFALAHAHRTKCAGLPKAAPVKLNPPKGHPLARILAEKNKPALPGGPGIDTDKLARMRRAGR